MAHPLGLDACVVAFDYAFPWDRLIVQFKFHGQVELATTLSNRLLAAASALEGPRPEWVLPIPVAPARLAERGYNQAWELARRVARGLSSRADAHLLERPTDGLHQAQLNLAQRMTNLHGAFLLNPARQGCLRDCHVAVVDDVMTTGATLKEAATVLRRAGARRVDAWVLARTPAPSD